MIVLKTMLASNIMRGVFASYSNMATAIICNIIIIPLYIRYLGRQEYGLWIAVSGITTYLSFLNLGIAQTTSNLFGKAVSTNNIVFASTVISTGFWRFAKVIALGVLLILLLSPFIPYDLLFKDSETVKHFSKTVIIFASVTFMLEMPLTIFGACLRNIDKISTQQTIVTFQNITRLCLAFYFLSIGGGLVGLILLLSSVNVLFHIIQFIMLSKYVKNLRVSVKLYDNKVLADMKAHNFYFLLLQVSGAIAFSTDTIVISATLGSESVTSFSIAQKIAFMAVGIVTTISSNFAPSFLEAYSKHNYLQLKLSYRRAMIISITLGIATTMLLLVAGPILIKAWVGSENYVGIFPFVMVIALVFIQMLLLPADTLLTVTNNHKGYALFGFWEAMLNLGLSIYLATIYGVGGVAMATLIARVFGTGPFLLWKSMKLILRV